MAGTLFAIAALLSAACAAAITRPGWPRAAWLVPVLCAVCSAVLAGAFVVGKTVGLLLMPTGLLWLIGFGVGLRLLARRRTRAALAVFGLWLAYTLAGNVWVGGALLNALEAPYRNDPTLAAPLDVLIVLGGATQVRPDGDLQVAPAGDRIVRSARLYHQGKTRRLLASGTSVGGIHQAAPRDLGGEARTLWRALGVPDEAIITLPGPRNTREEMQAAARWLAEQGDASTPLRRVGLLTSAWHLRRTLRQARRAGVDALPFAADFRGGEMIPSVMGLVPSGHGVYRIRLAVWEYLGAAVGR